MTCLISPPSVFSSTSEWERFLWFLLNMRENWPYDRSVQMAIKEAEQELASRQKDAA